MTVEIQVRDDPAVAAGTMLAAAAVANANLALSGGSTVARAHETAARLQGVWRDVHVWFGDDRAVPPDHELSNFRLAKETLLDGLAVQPELHRIRGELTAPEAADLYDEKLEGIRIDFALNGIGPDGHTASIFPGAPALDERERRAVAAEARLEPFVPRVTMTPPMFAAAELVVYLVTGADKAEAVRRAFAEDPRPEVPASLVRGRWTIAILDHAAATLLPGFRTS